MRLNLFQQACASTSMGSTHVCPEMITASDTSARNCRPQGGLGGLAAFGPLSRIVTHRSNLRRRRVTICHLQRLKRDKRRYSTSLLV
jgi:hypothetical protein